VTTAELTRGRILAAAESLMAERGIEAVSLREITRASGIRNTVGVQYHFKDRAGIVRAILAKHLPAVEAARHALLDDIEFRGLAELRPMAAALVRPLGTKLGDTHGGPSFLRVYAEVLQRQTNEVAPAGGTSSLERWRRMIEPLLEPDAIRLHRRFTALRLTAAELARRASSGPRHDNRLFVSHLVDLVTGVLGAPVSEETIRLADERDDRRAVGRAPG
jgi:AcrR family transcriptional regulator